MSGLSLTTHTGAISEFYYYELHGQHHALSSSGATTITSLTTHGATFTGARLMTEANLISFRRRLLSPGTGQFCSRDPMRFIDGKNMYTAYFVPKGFDPFGLSCGGCTIGDSRNEKASGISVTNAGIVGDPGDHDLLDLNEKELQLWFQVLAIFDALKGAKTKLDILGELLAELGPDGVHEVDKDRLKAAFDGLKDIVDLKHAYYLRVWVTVSGECCRKGYFLWSSNTFKEHDFHHPCSIDLENPNRTGIDEVDKTIAQRAYDEFIYGGGLKRCKEEAEKAFDCSNKSDKTQLNDPDDDVVVK